MKSTLLKTHFMLNSNLLLYIFYCSNDINELVLLLLYTIHSARLFGSKTILLHVQSVVKLALGKIITCIQDLTLFQRIRSKFSKTKSLFKNLFYYGKEDTHRMQTPKL